MRAVQLLAAAFIAAWCLSAQAQQRRWIEGMWSDPPATMMGELCGGACSDIAIASLNALVDNPKNDARPIADLVREASAAQQAMIRSRLLPDVAKNFPPDPADDPSFLNCEPYHVSRQILSRHQLQVTTLGRDRLELRNGEWDQRRTVFMDGRSKPRDFKPTRLGFSTGRWEGDALVVDTSGTTAGWGPANGIPVSEQLHIVERYTRGEDGKTLWLTATFTDPNALREPLALKRLWRWAPESEITPAADCEKPTSVRRRNQIQPGR
jgi:hypothetical protein